MTGMCRFDVKPNRFAPSPTPIKPGASSAAALPSPSHHLLSHEREKSIFCAAKAFVFTFQQRSDHLSSNPKKFSTSITAFRCDLLFCPAAPLDKIKDRSAATSTPRLLQPTSKMTLPLQNFDFANLSSILLVGLGAEV